MLKFVLLLVIGVAGLRFFLDLSNKKRLATRMASMGFEPDPYSKDSFVSSRTRISYAVSNVRRGKVHDYLLSAFISVHVGTRFTITKRGFFSQLLGTNKGNVRIDDR